MFKVKLKSGEVVQVPLDELEGYLKENRELIEVQKKEMGPRRQ